MKQFELHHGDCREVLRGMAANSVDSVVCDPPYHLTTGKKGGTGAASDNPNSPAGRARIGTGFMGKAWDGGDIAHDPAMWREVLRVLKPGGHLLAFGGSRTFHRLAVAIEDAGFELRDTVLRMHDPDEREDCPWLAAWGYGSGFPKSRDVSKALDKAAGAEREVIAKGKPVKRMIPGADQNATGSWIKDNGREYVPTETAPATDAARQWQGWGTALKPAFEPIVMARKPLDGTVAANVLAHGTGAINVDGCRVDHGGTHSSASSAGAGAGRATANVGAPAYGKGLGGVVDPPHDLGRWPANLIHDGSDEVLAVFPQTTSVGHTPSARGKGGVSTTGHAGQDGIAERHHDTGSAARFFYCAKASKADRGDGNTHPTVKPTALMRYLCRLVTPPGGVILDHFCGSGSTGKAAVLEGFGFIGIDLEAESIGISEARINAALESLRPRRAPAPTTKPRRRRAPAANDPVVSPQSDLFDPPAAATQ